MRDEFRERHLALTKGLKSIGWSVAASNGGMFVWAKYPFNMNDTDFVFEAIQQSGVVMVPGSVFGTEGKGYVRIALVREVDALERAVEELAKIDIYSKVE